MLDGDVVGATFLRGGGATGALIADYDWASTSLGPLSAWPASLKGATALILRSSVPMAILWGEAGVTLYNDPYSLLLGKDHPAILGSKALETSPVTNLAQRAIRTGLAGRTLALRDVELTMDRSGKREKVWFNIDCSPLLDDDGRPAGVLSIVVDNTARVRAERMLAVEVERLLRIQQRLTAALEVARLGTFEMDTATGEASLDARAREIFGFAPDQPLSIVDVLGRIDPENLHRLTSDACTGFAAGRTRRDYEYQVRLPDGATRHVLAVGDAVAGSPGRIGRVFGVFADVTERHGAERRQRLLINELNHRVKNTLATVQSIARQTLRSGAPPEEVNQAFEARLLALSAAHNLLNREGWRGAGLDDVAASVTAAFEAACAPQICRTGPHVWLAPQRALALSMALHELATNAAKHGALSRPEGRVAISWSVLPGSDELTLSWREHGGPPVSPPARTGFGSKLLQRNLPRELGGPVDLAFAPDGLRCEIRCRLGAAGPAVEFDV